MEPTGTRKEGRRWPVLATALACLAMGAAAGGWFMQRRAATPVAQPPPMPVAPVSVAVPPASQGEAREIVVSVPADEVERMGLAFARVTTEVTRSQLRVPGTVEPDGYREVVVSPVVGGIATEIEAQLGQTVKRGQKMAQLFSQELADAQTALISMDAELEVEHKKLLRVRELLGLGAASQEELDEVEAAHKLHTAHIEQARQRLQLLGLSPAQIDRVRAGNQINSDVMVPAPIDGVVIMRSVNPGQVVSTGQQLFTVTDLSSVWIEGNVLENDFGMVRVGSQAAITTPAYPRRTYRGAVDYIDPRVDPQTRTAKVRVIVSNSDLALRLGMYTDMLFSTGGGARVPVVPAGAVQQIGVKSVVYVPVEGEENRFQQREVTAGGETERGRLVLAGLRAGERVVTEGSFLLRAESLRQFRQ